MLYFCRKKVVRAVYASWMSRIAIPVEVRKEFMENFKAELRVGFNIAP
jgi:hypothetical protein